MYYNHLELPVGGLETSSYTSEEVPSLKKNMNISHALIILNLSLQNNPKWSK